VLDCDWILDGRLLAMAAPWPDEADELRELGVRAIVTLTGRIPEGFPLDDLAHLHVPVLDFHPPSQRQLDGAVAFIDEQIAGGGAVAVHCAAGRGRTGTFAAAYLVSLGATADAAIREVRRRRPGSVETTQQELAVLEFAQRRAAQAGGGA
jgi:atypical dual specificity phosphatase